MLNSGAQSDASTDGVAHNVGRIESDHLSLTQEFLGQRLGTRRSSVTVAAGGFAKSWSDFLYARQRCHL
jgi:hypothetical protein